MKTKFTILTAVALLLIFSLNAQVAINTDGSDPDGSAMLDIQSSTKGFSLPNLNIADMSTAAPVTSPKTGLVAYNTNTSTGPGIVMWTGSKWVKLEIEGINWKLLGNEGTNASNNFVGTTDNVSLPFRTNNTERMRIEDDGQITIDNGYTAPHYTSDKFTVNGNTTNWSAINGYSGVSGGYGVYGEDGGNGIGVCGNANGATGFGMYANNDYSSGTGLIAVGNSQTGSYLTNGTGVAGTGGNGIFGKGKDNDGTGIIGVGNNNDSVFTLVGGTGGAFTGHSGIYAKVDGSSAGTGVIGAGYNISTAATTSNGSGGAFTGQDGALGTGVSSTGTGIIGVGNNNNNGSGYVTISSGSGGAFTGTVCGAFGYATNTSGDRYGGYFATAGGAYAYVGVRTGGTNYKIIGSGDVSTIVKDVDNKEVIMVCPEAPESLFQDYGIGQLTNGKTHITLDPVFAKNIQVDAQHPIKVFVTLEGDCNGVYVTNKSKEGFDVVELQGGTSNVSFSWQIVATRANEEFVQKDGSIETSDFSKRFPPGPGPLKTKIEQGRSIQQKVLQQKAVEVKDVKKKEEPKQKIEDNK